MDCLVSQLTSRSSQIANRRKVWPARRHLDNLEIADIAAPDLFTERRMVGVKAPVEAQHDGNVCGPDDAHGIDRFLIIQADWLLAVDSFAGPGPIASGNRHGYSSRRKQTRPPRLCC